MLKQLGGRWSLLWVLSQAQRNEGLEVFGPASVDIWRVFLHDVEDNAALRFTDVWWVAVRNLHREGRMPPRIAISERLVGWRESDLEAWLQSSREEGSND